MHGPCSVGDAELLGEILELLGMRVVVVGVAVAHDAHGLARVGPTHRRLVLPAGQQRVLVAEHAPGLGRGDEAGAHPDAVGAEGECRREATPVEDAAGRHHRDTIAHRVDDLWDERHGRHLAGVAARFGALGHDEVATRVDRPHGVFDLPAHVDDEHVGAVALLDHLGGDAQARQRRPWRRRR